MTVGPLSWRRSTSSRIPSEVEVEVKKKKKTLGVLACIQGEGEKPIGRQQGERLEPFSRPSTKKSVTGVLVKNHRSSRQE